MLYQELLSVKGHEIVGGALDGTECLEKLNDSNEDPDFILLDHRMTINDGIETVKEILRVKPELKIILVSSDESIKDKAIKAGVISFIKKPFNLKNFYNSINQLIN